MFWQTILEFLAEYWLQLLIGGGTAYNCVHRPKTKEEKTAIKKEKSHKRSVKLERKLHAAYEKEATFEGVKNE
jgi:hypothetical protein